MKRKILIAVAIVATLILVSLSFCQVRCFLGLENCQMSKKTCCASKKSQHDLLGKMAPDFTLPDVRTGEFFHLGDFLGKKPVVLVFWAAWCPDCVEELPLINALADKQDDSFELVLIQSENIKGRNELKTREESLAVLEKLETKMGSIKGRVLFDLTGEVYEKAYDVRAIPSTFLIDANGEVKNLYMGSLGYHEEEGLFSNLGKLLNSKK